MQHIGLCKNYESTKVDSSKVRSETEITVQMRIPPPIAMTTLAVL